LTFGFTLPELKKSVRLPLIGRQQAFATSSLEKKFMKTNFVSRNMPASKLYAGLLIAGTVGSILLSPKWVIPVFAWIAPTCLLFYFRYATVRFKVLWLILALLIAQMVSSYDVAPFPTTGSGNHFPY
jgi:hypothetical protein